MKRIVKNIIAVISFLCIFGLVFYIVDTTLKFKYADGILTIEDLYEYPDNSIDVLLLGSSHVGVNIDPTQLNSEYGMAAYSLWGSVQPTWNSYFYLKEALKTQKPKVVVLEGFLTSQDYEYMDYSRIIKNTLGMKLSQNKLEAINVSATNDVKKDIYLGFSTYHTRYAELVATDFTRFPWNFELADKSISNGTGITPCKIPEIEGADGYKDLKPKMKEYLLKIMELCKSENIPLMIFVSPFSASKGELERFNTVQKLAEENGVTFINYNKSYEEIGIDFTKDFADSAGHLNDGGVAKLTNALGTFLTENYELPDRTGDKWFAKKAPEEAAYMLESPFVGDGTSLFVDTDQKLFYDPKDSWTIFAKINNKCDSADKVFFSCFNEEQPYGGLLVRQNDGELQIILGNNYYVETKIPVTKTSTIAIVKEGSKYAVYLDGERVEANINSAYDSYGGTLLIGCQNTTESDKTRFSAVTVSQLEVFKEARSENDVKDWMEKNKTLLTKEEKIQLLKEQYTGEINYSFEEGFTGDGESKYVDTGTQLFYEPNKDWTLLTDINTSFETMNGVFVSCFSEEEGQYRGIMIRKDDNVFHVILGKNYYVEVMLSEDESAKIAVTKKGDTYSVFVNGIAVAQNIVSPCGSYLGDLLIGCQDTADFDKFRYSGVTVNRVEVRDRVMSQSEIQSW